MEPAKPTVEEVDKVYDTVAALLANRHPAVQGAVLADLLSTWLAGHPPGHRTAILKMHVKGVRQLMRVKSEKTRKTGKKVRL